MRRGLIFDLLARIASAGVRRSWNCSTTSSSARVTSESAARGSQEGAVVERVVGDEVAGEDR